MILTEGTIQTLSDRTILSEDVFYSLLEVEDSIDRERLRLCLEQRARSLGQKTAFTRLWNEYKKQQRQLENSYKGFRGEVVLRYNEKGEPANTIENFSAVLNGDPILKDSFLLNELSGNPERLENGEPRRWLDEDDSWLRAYIEKKYHLHNREKLDDAARIKFSQNRYHPVREKIMSLTWDGVPRIKRLFIKWLRAEDCPYSEEVCRLFFAGGIHRAFEPGCKFDAMPVFIGLKQGEGKSTFIRWLAMEDKWFRDVKEIDGQRGIEAIEGAWICEVGELLALKRAQDVEAVKSYITRQCDTYRRPFDRRTTDHPRQCVFLGTTNNAQFLTDRTGNRRFFPLDCQSDGRFLFDHQDEIKADIEQCWAEAYALYVKGELPAVDDRDLADEIRDRQESAVEDDWRIGMIEDYLDSKNVGDRTCCLELWQRALGMEGKPSRKDSAEINILMQRFTFWKKFAGGVQMKPYGYQKGWVKAGTNETADLPF